MKLINLDEGVIKALDLFSKQSLPRPKFGGSEMLFVVGSGNAYNTGAIMFAEQAAILADESNFRRLMQAYKPAIKSGLIRTAVIISASGEKDSVWEIELAKKNGLKTILLTCGASSSAAKIADKTYIYKKLAEPYTYNVSTYLGMILSLTGERPSEIKKFLLRLRLPKNFSNFDAYSFILPDKYRDICAMIEIKHNELFGPRLSLRSFSQGNARHAKFVIPWSEELVVSLGEKNVYFGLPKNRWDIALPKNFSYGAVLSLAYYLVGKIQATKPPYFKENIKNYCEISGPAAYGKHEPFEVIVPEN
jgi:hypothetical protein